MGCWVFLCSDAIPSGLSTWPSGPCFWRTARMTRFISATLVVLASLIALTIAAAPAAAQDFRGGIRGTIADTTGGVLPGVTVTVTNTATGVAQTVVTDDKGLFEVLYLNS